MSMKKGKELLDEVRDLMRLKHYSVHTERSYCDWIKRYVRFHGMSSRNDLKDGEKKVEEFLTHLAVDNKVVNKVVKSPISSWLLISLPSPSCFSIAYFSTSAFHFCKLYFMILSFH